MYGDSISLIIAAQFIVFKFPSKPVGNRVYAYVQTSE